MSLIEEIIKVFKEYSNMVGDEIFIKKLAHIIISEQNTQEFVENGVKIEEEPPVVFCEAGYKSKERRVYFYTKEMLANSRYEACVYYPEADKVNEMEKNTLINLLLAQTVFHEMEHVNQQRKMRDEKGIESTLLNYSTDKDETVFTYNVSPSERLAEIMAFRKTIEIAKRLDNVTPEMIRYFEKQEKDSVLRGYEIGENLIFPTYEYLKEHSLSQNEILEISMQQNLSLEERIVYGLNITKEEYETYKGENKNIGKADLAKADKLRNFSFEEIKDVIKKIFKNFHENQDIDEEL